jgi:hypothetical protein
MLKLTKNATVWPWLNDAFREAHGFQLQGNLLVLATIGSEAHGTKLVKPQGTLDDSDLLGVVVPPTQHVVGLMRPFESWEYKQDHWDIKIYSFGFYVRLLLGMNPNVTDLLYLADAFLPFQAEQWVHLQTQRDAFNSIRAAATYAGYARGQLQRMTSYTKDVDDRWLEAVAIVEAGGFKVADVTAKHHLDMPDFVGIGRKMQALYDEPRLPDEAQVRGRLKEAIATIQQIRAKYHQAYMGEKRRSLVVAHGYDTKNAAHLIRLLRMCIEFLGTGEMQVYRTHDAEELKAIKRGEWPLERVQAEAETLFGVVETIKPFSPLPPEPAYDVCDAAVRRIYGAAWGVNLQRG